MKKILFFLFLVFQTYAFACKCDQPGKVGIQFQESDFVGEIEILNITPKNNSRSYIADIKVLHNYKGEDIKKIEVLGKLNDIQSAACEVKLKAGEKYIFYLSKNGGNNIWSMTGSGNVKIDEEYVVTACTPKTLIGTDSDDVEKERKVLNFFANNSFGLAQAFYFDKSNDRSKPADFKNFELTEPKNFFAVFKLKVNHKSEVEDITAVQNFGSKEDETVMKLIKKNFVIVKDLFTEVQDEEVLLTLFYVPENKDKEFEDTITLVLPGQQF